MIKLFEMNAYQNQLVFDRTSMLNAIQAFEIESAMKVNPVCHYLEAFQKSPQAWSISSDMLWELDEHRITVLIMCGTMLRQKVRTQLKWLTNEAQGQLRDTLLGQVKNAAQSQREGIESIKSLIVLIIADVGVRMRNCPFFVGNLIAELWCSAPQALFDIVQVLPEQPGGEKLQQQLELLRSQSDMVLQLLTNFQSRTDMDSISIGRGCLLSFGAWANRGLLPLESVLQHTVVLQAIALLEQPDLMQRQLYGDACKCLVGVINGVGNHPLQHSNSDVMQQIRDNIFGIVNCIAGNFNQLQPKEKDDSAEIFNKLTEVFAGIRDEDINSDFLVKAGPFCFQLQLQVADQCSIIIVLDSLQLWHQLASQLPHHYELELYDLFQPLVQKFLMSFYAKCRLTHPSHVQSEGLSTLRSHFRDLIAKFAELLGLKVIVTDLFNQISDPLTSESDMELALFCLGTLVEFLDSQLPHMVDELMYGLPKFYARTLFCSLPAHEQLIICLTKCHEVKNNPKLRYDFVEHLSNLCEASEDKVLITAALEAFNVLANMYTDIAELKHLFKTPRMEAMFLR